MAKRKAKIQHAEIVQRFAIRLRELRQARGLTQLELARQAQVALSHLSKLESGDAAPGLDLLDRLAVAFGITVPDLLPIPASPETITDLRAQAKGRLEVVLKRFDADMLIMLNTLLSRIG